MGVSGNADRCVTFYTPVLTWIRRGLAPLGRGGSQVHGYFCVDVAMIITRAIVRIYYWRQDARRAEPLRNDVRELENGK